MLKSVAFGVAFGLGIAATAAFGQGFPQPTQAPAAKPATAPTPAPAPAAAPTPTANATCANPNALGVSRVVEIDTSSGPGFGFEHFKAYDFLKDKEVVLTFDDGPWPGHTPAVLKALADQCTKALFFPIGKHAGWHPEILKEVVAAGHTVGSHTWSHADLMALDAKSPDDAKAEIEKGISAVSIALGNKPIAPFFRFPALRHPPDMLKYLADRHVGVFSTDIDSFDFKIHKPDAVIASLFKKLDKRGKGILLMHDFQEATAKAIPEILAKLKAGGYKVVQITGKTPIEPLPEYNEIVLKEIGGGLDTAKPMSSVIKTISGN
ncbi:MAG TPA: polysaccharide deacetylase family protein [Pseudolabrys sp.]|nr:polysaccharide deacetylase family protein [Pseudolabrys sp.]